MYLKNYTSKVSADVTIARIERLLVNAGATGFQKLYEGGLCSAIVFQISFERGGMPINVRLPANVQRCQEALFADYVKASPNGRKEKADFADQAAQTAWRLVQDWVEVQVSLIHLKQVEFLQVFLPYVWDGQRTYYEALRETGFKALLPERSK